MQKSLSIYGSVGFSCLIQRRAQGLSAPESNRLAGPISFLRDSPRQYD